MEFVSYKPERMSESSLCVREEAAHSPEHSPPSCVREEAAHSHEHSPPCVCERRLHIHLSTENPVVDVQPPSQQYQCVICL